MTQPVGSVPEKIEIVASGEPASTNVQLVRRLKLAVLAAVVPMFGHVPHEIGIAVVPSSPSRYRESTTPLGVGATRPNENTLGNDA
ncbi:hypothetical protein [Reyranella sp.]|uniref:hypothetical protein n=1 Tax=Reyranella sp. TaxID=1929291 RepID=UPI003D14EADB